MPLAQFLFQPDDLAEHFVNDAAAFDEDHAEERPGFAGDVLDNQAAVFHAHFVEAFQFFIQRFGENFPALNGVDGIYIKRRQIFRDKWIKHGGYYPKYLLKMFRRGSVKTDARDLVDHHFYVTGKTIKLRRDLLEVNKKEDDISFWIEKHNRYAALLAKEEMENKRTSRAHVLAPSFLGKPDQQSLMLKKVWSRMPLYVRPFLYFLYRYFFRLGFLDGKQGAIFHFLHAFWFRLLVDIKLDELQKQGARG